MEIISSYLQRELFDCEIYFTAANWERMYIQELRLWNYYKITQLHFSCNLLVIFSVLVCLLFSNSQKPSSPEFELGTLFGSVYFYSDIFFILVVKHKYAKFAKTLYILARQLVRVSQACVRTGNYRNEVVEKRSLAVEKEDCRLSWCKWDSCCVCFKCLFGWKLSCKMIL